LAYHGRAERLFDRSYLRLRAVLGIRVSTAIARETQMSYQAYLDNIEAKTGKTPTQFIELAGEAGLRTHRDIVSWLKADYGLGLGHARAMAGVILHGPEFELRQTTGTHRDESGTLRLTGKDS